LSERPPIAILAINVNTLADLRRLTVERNFPKPTSLKRALHAINFVQADPIRAPARAQDLILRHRVTNYHAGDLERQYATLDIDEDVFVNYGFVTRRLQALMHPRSSSPILRDENGRPWPRAQSKRAALLLEFVRERGVVHPRDVDQHFSHGKVQNYWGGTSNATTHLLDLMHYRGLLRVARREKGIRLYSAYEHHAGSADAAERGSRVDGLVDTVVRIYAPLPAASLSVYVRRLRYAAPQWREELTAALQRAKDRLLHARVGGTDWYWPAESVREGADETVRLLAPFDPVVHDRARFERLWGWAYRFEAYTPVARRKLGYYALPLLWRDRVIGWANLALKNGDLEAELGYANSQPRERAYRRELEAELERVRLFLGVER